MADWKAFLDTLVSHWREDAPAFDADALRASVLALKQPAAKRVVEEVMHLAQGLIPQPDGSSIVDFDDSRQEAAEEWLTKQLPATLPALLLALRHPDHMGQARAEAIVGEARNREALSALMAMIESPAKNLASHLGGRPHHMPTWAMIQLGKPPKDIVTRLIRALDHEDFRIAGAGAVVLAEFADDDAIFEALWSRKARAERSSDQFAWALMRAAEVRRDPMMRPYLQWMLRSDRFDSAGYHDRIREALGGLRKPASAKPGAGTKPKSTAKARATAKSTTQSKRRARR